MTSPKTKTTVSNPDPSRARTRSRRAKLVQKEQEKFSAVVGSIAKRYGVKVASVASPATNPYAMSAEQSAKLAVKAGIITPAGNLKLAFK